jgi:hypothetical protein
MMCLNSIDAAPTAWKLVLPLMNVLWTAAIPHSLQSNLHKQLEMMMIGVQIKKKLKD